MSFRERYYRFNNTKSLLAFQTVLDSARSATSFCFLSKNSRSAPRKVLFERTRPKCTQAEDAKRGATTHLGAICSREEHTIY